MGVDGALRCAPTSGGEEDREVVGGTHRRLQGIHQRAVGDPAARSYRLHWSWDGSLEIDDETIGGDSVPLTWDPAGLPAPVVEAPPVETAPAPARKPRAAKKAAAAPVAAETPRTAKAPAKRGASRRKAAAPDTAGS